MVFEVTVCTQVSEGQVRYVNKYCKLLFYFILRGLPIPGNRNEPEWVVVLFAEALDLLQRADDQTDGGQLGPRVRNFVLVKRKGLKGNARLLKWQQTKKYCGGCLM